MPTTLKLELEITEQELAYLNSKIGEHRPYADASAFVRELIQAKQQEEAKTTELDFSEMPVETDEEIMAGILEGLRDYRAGRYIVSSGDLIKDLESAKIRWPDARWDD